ncbi:hypothetical protein VTO42DRAFT_470 [Malbranchea cinnamomea]
MTPANTVRLLDFLNHLNLVDRSDGNAEEGNVTGLPFEQLRTAPLFSSQLLATLESSGASAEHGVTASELLPQYGLMGLCLETYGDDGAQDSDFDCHQSNNASDRLVYSNTNAPWSTFICGSQGSGKSHTLSCMLENSLLVPSSTGRITAPLTALVLHYDKFTGIESSQVCEAAYLCSSGIPVRVLVSPSNLTHMKKLYENLPGLPEGCKRPEVIPLKFVEKHLNIGMMKSLMAVGSEGSTPLYMEVVTKILREMAEDDQPFDFVDFKKRLGSEHWLNGQASPLEMRLRLLESFLVIDKAELQGQSLQKPKKRKKKGGKTKQTHDGLPKAVKSGSEVWDFLKGSLTIVDLSCPFVDENDACALFNICISIFLEGRKKAGRIVALDEAHKFLTTRSREAANLTETMLSLIRQQRHLATRVIIATQEPTLSPSLLDLCNVTIVHRFMSPAWFKMLRNHLAGAIVGQFDTKDSDCEANLFSRIVRLKTGECLVFCPSAILCVETSMETPSSTSTDDLHGVALVKVSNMHPRELGPRYFRMKIRKRVTVDGGRSILAQ